MVKVSRQLLAGLFMLIMQSPIAAMAGEQGTTPRSPAQQEVTAPAELTDRERLLIDILRMPSAPVNLPLWLYSPADFESSKSSAREKLAGSKTPVADKDPAGSREAGADRNNCLPYLELPEENRRNKQWLSEAEECFANRIRQKGRTAEDHYLYHVFLHNRVALDFLGNPSSFLAGPGGIDAVTSRLRAMTSDQNLSLVGKAVEMDPDNIRYRASLAALQVGRISIVYMENLEKAFNEPSAAEEPHARASRLTTAKTDYLFREAESNIAFVDKRARDIYPRLYFLNGSLRFMREEYEHAERSLLKAVSLDPAAGLYYEMLIYLYARVLPGAPQLKQGRMERVAGLIQKKCEGACSPAERRIIARIRFDSGQYNEAERQLRLALADEPSSFPLRTSLAVTLFKRHRYQEADRELSAAKNYYEQGEATDKAHFCSFIAVLQLLQGEEESARQWLRDALELNENDPVARALVKN